jgi:hypothetical protein
MICLQGRLNVGINGNGRPLLKKSGTPGGRARPFRVLPYDANTAHAVVLCAVPQIPQKGRVPWRIV